MEQERSNKMIVTHALSPVGNLKTTRPCIHQLTGFQSLLMAAFCRFLCSASLECCFLGWAAAHQSGLLGKNRQLNSVIVYFDLYVVPFNPLIFNLKIASPAKVFR